MNMPYKNINLWFFALMVMSLSIFSGCSDDKGSKAADKAGKDAAAKVSKDARPLIIGIVGPETGDESKYGLSVVEGALAAAKRFNAQGGVDGKEIQVVHLDDQNNIELTTKAVQELIRQKAIAILAAPTGSSTFAPVHLVNESKTIFISVGSRRHLKRSGEYVFRTAVPDETATEDLIKYAVTEMGYVNYALVTAADNDFSLDLSSMFKKALDKYQGVIKVEADTYDSFTGGHNLKPVIAAIKKSPDKLHGVIFTGGATEAVLLAKELRKAGLTLPVLGGEDLFSEEYLQGGEAVNETLFYTTFSADKKSAKMEEFIKDYGKANPDRFAALSYDTFMLVADAIKGAGSTDTAKVREALINRKECVGVTGNTSFTAENMPVKHPIICKIKRGEGSDRVLLLKQ